MPELLDDDCDWVAHHPWGRYTELLEQGADACLLVGMHARNNTKDGVLCHTISTVKWHNLWFNDDLVGESGVNAALCGHYGCPVLLVTGDEAVCREVTDLLGAGLTTVAVKRGLTRYSARQIPPGRARRMIEEGAYQALQNLTAVKPYAPSSPVTITIEVDKVEKMDDFRGKTRRRTGPGGAESLQPRRRLDDGLGSNLALDRLNHRLYCRRKLAICFSVCDSRLRVILPPEP